MASPSDIRRGKKKTEKVPVLESLKNIGNIFIENQAKKIAYDDAAILKSLDNMVSPRFLNKNTPWMTTDSEGETIKTRDQFEESIDQLLSKYSDPDMAALNKSIYLNAITNQLNANKSNEFLTTELVEINKSLNKLDSQWHSDDLEPIIKNVEETLDAYASNGTRINVNNLNDELENLQNMQNLFEDIMVYDEDASTPNVLDLSKKEDSDLEVALNRLRRGDYKSAATKFDDYEEDKDKRYQAELKTNLKNQQDEYNATNVLYKKSINSFKTWNKKLKTNKPDLYKKMEKRELDFSAIDPTYTKLDATNIQFEKNNIVSAMLQFVPNQNFVINNDAKEYWAEGVDPSDSMDLTAQQLINGYYMKYGTQWNDANVKQYLIDSDIIRFDNSFVFNANEDYAEGFVYLLKGYHHLNQLNKTENQKTKPRSY